MNKCQKCRNFSISWDKDAPYACKLYQIKSKVMPIEIVKASGYQDCLGFEDKKSLDQAKDAWKES